MSSTDPDRSLESLCCSCALCCDGTLFFRLRLAEDDDLDGLAEFGLRPSQDERGAYVDQPCAMLEGKRCQAYSVRPRACRRYRCAVLKRYEEGEISLQYARELIHRALVGVEEIEQEWEIRRPGHENVSFSWIVKELSEGENRWEAPEIRRRHAPMLLRIVSLVRHLESFEPRAEEREV